MNAPAIKGPPLKFPSFKIPQIKIPKFTFPSLGAGKSGKILVLEIGEEWLKYAYVVQDGNRRKILHLGAEKTAGLDEVQRGLKITEIVKTRNLKPTRVMLSHPTHQLTTRILVLPSIDPKEIKDILELQAVKQTPYSKDEITTGFHILERDATGYSRVLLAISHRDVASRYYRTAEYAGLMSDQIAISLDGIAGWYQRVRTQDPPGKDQAVLLLDCDWQSTDLLIFVKDQLIFSRSIGIGVKHLREQGIVMEGEFLREVQRSLEAALPELKAEKVTCVILTGMGDEIKNLLAVLSRELNLPCERIAPFKNFENAAPKSAMDAWSTLPVSPVSILGLAIASEAAKINLIPAELEMRKGLEQRAKDLAVMGTLMLALVMLISGVCFERIYKKGGYFDKLQKEYASIRKEAEEAERLVSKMKLANQQMNARGSFLDVLHDLNEVIPPNIYLISVQFHDRDKQLVIRGISDEMSGVFQFLSTLEATPVLEFVKSRSVTKRKVEDKEKAEFEIVASIEGLK